jgi:hypothetical protein
MKYYELLFEVGPLGVDGSATYSRSDLTLLYAPDAERVPSIQVKGGRLSHGSPEMHAMSVYLLADTLTLRFNEERVLIAIDAYTNHTLWEPSTQGAETPSARGKLRIDWSLDTDRALLSGVPTYAISTDWRRLHIKFGPPRKSAAYYEVGFGLMVGLAEQELCEIIVEDLKVT